MSRLHTENVLAVGTSFLTIVAPKFCCWSTALAAVSSGASYLAWVYPMRSYLFALSFVLIGYSFYKRRQLTLRSNPKKTGCQVCKKSNETFLQSRSFIWLSTLFVLVMFLISYF